MNRELIDLHAHLRICQPKERLGRFYHVCECGALVFLDPNVNEWKRCETDLSTDQEAMEDMLQYSEELFVKVLRVHVFRRAIVPKYYLELAREL